jgi:hypothetical protein
MNAIHRLLLVLVLGTTAMLLFYSPDAPSSAAEKSAAGPLLSHDVYFTLHEASPAAQEKMVAACQKYLSQHEGTVFFGAGTLCEELDRPVNDRDFHIALHIVFKDKAAHDKYQAHPDHLKFIEENKANWKQVRVFDSYIKTNK